MRYFVFIFKLISIVALSSIRLHAQINVEEANVQAITYFNKHDKTEYYVWQQQLKVVDADTITHFVEAYFVEMEVLDSNPKSYDIQWTFCNYSSMDMRIPNAIAQTDVMLPVIKYKTDDVGTFLEMVNWEDVMAYIQSSKIQSPTNKSIGKADVPSMGLYNKKYIENIVCAPIHQMHFFYGLVYELGKAEYLNGQITSPVDEKGELRTDYLVKLEDMNAEEGYYIISGIQNINEEDLRRAIEEVLGRELMQTQVYKDLGEKGFETLLKNTIEISNTYHNSGWLIYSEQLHTFGSDAMQQWTHRIISIL